MANDLVLGAKLSQAVYSSYNQSNTPEVDGWKPVHLVDRYFQPERADPAFGAQLYQKGDQFMVVFRGTQPSNLADVTNNAYIGGVWQQEMTDTIRFAGGAVEIGVRSRFQSNRITRAPCPV